MRLSCLLFLFCLNAAVAADHWPQFRGPSGDGRADVALPQKFGEGQNVKWKTPIHGKAWSSPVIWGPQIWLTTATEDGTQLSVVCVEKDTGKIVRDDVIFRIAKPQFCHKFNSYASPTPVIEEGRLYATFGSPGTACIDTATGKVLWERTDLECNHYRGAGSSPVVWQNLLIMPFDGSDLQYVIALDKQTGKTVWKTDRSIDFKDLDKDGKPEAEGDMRKAFATPTVIEHEGKPVLISSGAKAHYGYDPATGKELWRFEERAQHSASARPVIGNGTAYIAAGYSAGQVLAIKLGGSGLLSDTHLAFRVKKAAPNKPSLILDGDLLYMINDGGIASCVEAATGTPVWSERVGGNYSASPLLAGGHLYFCSEEGKVAVVKTGRTFTPVAENQLEGGFMASPAVSGKALYLRSKTHLFRIEE